MGPHLRGGAPGLSGPAPPPAIIVHSLAHAVAALEAAAGRDIVLLSAPDAGTSVGPGWWTAVVAAARAAVPAAHFRAVLDCGDEPGAAMGAIRAGAEAIVFSGRSDVAERLADIASQRGCRVLGERPPAVLDLADLFFADPAALRRRCADALASSGPIC